MTHSTYLAIEGVIGVGKTTLARLLQPRFGSELLLEAFDQNPFLTDFYADRARYAFQTQMFFLLSRYRQGQSLPSLVERSPVIADYIFAKDSLFAHLNLLGDELDMYDRLYSALAEQIPQPDLVIYLRANTDVLMTRIAIRDRPYEREMDRSYIESLRQAYEQLFAHYNEAPLLVVDTNTLDFVHDPEALSFIESQVRMRLQQGHYQQLLPQMDAAGLAHPTPPAAPARPAQEEAASPWTAVEAYLTASEAMGRLGALLARVGGLERLEAPRAEMSETLHEVTARLQKLAEAMGVDSWLPTQGVQ